MSFGDPFGLMELDFRGSKEAEAAYNAGKAALTKCASGGGRCNKADAEAAAAGLALLNHAEASSEVYTVVLRTSGQPLPRGVPAMNEPYGSGRAIAVDVRSYAFSGGHITTVPEAVAHEVMESVILYLAGNMHIETSRGQAVYPAIHAQTVLVGDDPLRKGLGRRSRTECSPRGISALPDPC